MIEFELYLLFIASVAALGLLPGPNVAVICANSLAHGRLYGFVCVAGTSAAMIPQLAVTVLGATTLLMLLASAFEWLRWAGVAYLIGLGVREWLRCGSDEPLEMAPERKARTARAAFERGFIISLTNPKTLLFFAAFLPQFVSDPDRMALQMTILAVTFLAVVTLVDCGWACLADRARTAFPLLGRLRHKISGGFFLLAGLGLALARKP